MSFVVGLCVGFLMGVIITVALIVYWLDKQDIKVKVDLDKSDK